MMSYTLPFKPGEKIFEFAGGDRPAFRPNIDVRPGPTVDLVADLNRPLPIAGDQCDGIFMRYGLEHLSWRRVRGFLGDCHRILKPGGVAVFVVPDTLAQMAMLLSKDRWEDADAGTLMGDQNYEGDAWQHNAHHAIFSHEYAQRLCREAGFFDVKTVQLPEWLPGQSPFDMIIEARKSAAEIARGLPAP